MCEKPIRIKNNNKYIATGTGHQMYIWVNCGHCKECRREKQIEWTLRTYYETLETLHENQWIYFDTLTYRNETLPRISQFLETKYNFCCFNRKHIREFYEKLRGIYNDKTFKFFIVSEYGELRGRSHYHIMLFVKENIDKIEFSKNVAKAWTYGRTDGQPYKSKLYVLEHNIIETLNLKAIRYISKYVNKSQTFTDKITQRWMQIEKHLKLNPKYNTLKIKKIKRQYMNHCKPFHTESRKFGISAINYMNIEDIWEKNRIYYKDDSLKINQYVKLPMYYKRKLFEKQIKYNGKRIWINTEEGIRWKTERENKIIKEISNRYLDKAFEMGYDLNKDKAIELAKYNLFERGRLKGKPDYKAHHKEAEYFQYNTDKDLKYIGRKCISNNFAGNDKIGYETTAIEDNFDLENEIYINPEYEKIIERLQLNKDNKSLILLKEHLEEMKKIYFK